MGYQKIVIAVIVLVICLVAFVQPQFWRMNSPSERDIFIMETKSSMASGICYKQVLGNSADPELRMQTISFCCAGYRQRNAPLQGMQCEPICSEDCMNGICTAPETCECYPGYARLGGRCEEA